MDNFNSTFLRRNQLGALLSSIMMVFVFMTMTSCLLYGQRPSISKSSAQTIVVSAGLVTYDITGGCDGLTGNCTPYKLCDTIPEFGTFIAGAPVPHPNTGATIIAVYDPANNVVCWDFGFLEAGSAANVSFDMAVDTGVLKDGEIIENEAIVESGTGIVISNQVDIEVDASPKWDLRKIRVTPFVTYHGDLVRHRLDLCNTGGITGNQNLYNITISDQLPCGAVFESSTVPPATNDGMGGLTWTIDTLLVTMSGCTSITVNYRFPLSDPCNDTAGGPITKTNKAGAEADTPEGPLGFDDVATTSNRLDPPFFSVNPAGTGKTAGDNNLLVIDSVNHYTIRFGNASTKALINYTVYDSLPSQTTLVRTTSGGCSDYPYTICYNEGLIQDMTAATTNTYCIDVSTSTIDTVINVSDLGLDSMTHYVKSVKITFDTVPRGFGLCDLTLLVTDAYYTCPGMPTGHCDNTGMMVDICEEFINCAQINAELVPGDAPAGTVIDEVEVCEEMVLNLMNTARLDPHKTQKISYIDPPPGVPTTGNPYFPGARVQYCIRVENDGPDGGSESFQIMTDPVAVDILPVGMTFDGDWWIESDNTGRPHGPGPSPDNPVLTIESDVPSLKETRLTWRFSDDFIPNDQVYICFHATIDDTVANGTVMNNSMCINSNTLVSCDNEAQGKPSNFNSPATYDPNDYLMMSDYMENPDMCCTSVTLTVQDSTAYPQVLKRVISTGPYVPTGVPGGTSTIVYEITLRNNSAANRTMVDPILADFLSAKTDFCEWDIISNTTGLVLDTMGVNPVFNNDPDYMGSGREFLSWTFDGDFPIGGEVKVKVTVKIKAGEAGTVNNTAYSYTGVRKECVGISALDTNDINGDGDYTQCVCNSPRTATRINDAVSLKATKWVLGCDDVWVRHPDTARVFPDSIFPYRIELINVGNIDIDNFVLIDILPTPGDMGVRLYDIPRGSCFEPLLRGPITDVPDVVTVYYSTSDDPCRSDEQILDVGENLDCDPPNWQTSMADYSTVRSVKFEFEPSFIVKALDTINLSFEMNAPIPKSVCPACNSFAWKGNRMDNNTLLRAEPFQACIIAKVDTVGNYVWIDENMDGIQDDTETPIVGANMSLYSEDGILLATTTTDANGLYWFSSEDEANQTWTGDGDANYVIPGRTYYIIAGDGQTAGPVITVGGTKYVLTTEESVGSTVENDSDGELGDAGDPAWVDGKIFHSVNAGDPAADPTIDFGFFEGEWDLALRKILVSAGPYVPGDTVEFQIEVYNQEIIDAFNVDIVDYIPAGFIFSDTNPLNTGWGGAPTAPMYTIDELLTGEADTISIWLEIFDTKGPDSDWWNYAEIADFEDAGGGHPDDKDSNPASDGPDERGVEPGDLEDNDVTSTDKGGEEDDHDVAGLIVSRYDLALRKTTAQVDPVKAGDDVTWDITVYNQGDEPVDSIRVVDYIPCSFEFIQADNPGWTQAGDSAYFILTGVLSPGDSSKTSIDLRVLAGVNTADSSCLTNESEIVYFEDIFDNPQDDTDSSPDDNPDNDNDVTPGSPDDNKIDGNAKDDGEDEDDNDVAMVDIYDLALKKVISPSSPGPYRYGDPVQFDIWVFNQGTMVADDIDVTDYVPAGFTYDYTRAINVTNAWTPAATALPMTTIRTPLNPGDSTKITIELIITPGSEDPDRFVNYAEISYSEDADGNDMTEFDYDSHPDFDIGDDVGGEPMTDEDNHIDDDGMDTDGDGILDEDDHDPALIAVFDLALKKELVTPPSYNYGDPIEFSITVENQGTMIAENIVITDDVPSGYFYDMLLNPTWTQSVTTSPQTTIGAMNPGEVTVLTIKLTLQKAIPATDTSWVNYAWIESAQDTAGGNPVDADSEPGTDNAHERDVLPGGDDDNVTDEHYYPDLNDEDDHDPAEVRIFDLALRKTFADPGPYVYGQSIPFEITVFNQGPIPATFINIYDYVPEGFEYDVAMNFGTWNYTGDPINIAETTLAEINPLESGDSLKVTLWLIFQNTDGTNPDAWTNYAEIEEARDDKGIPVGDIDSTPDGDNDDPGGEPDTPTDDEVNETAPLDEDDHDPARPEVFDLALRKMVVPSGPYAYGDTLTFDIWVFNQGNVWARDVVVSDYIPVGYSYDHSLNSADWTNDPDPTTTIDEIAAGDSQMVSIKLIIEMTTGGDKAWINYAEITAASDTFDVDRTNDDMDSNPGSDNPTENMVEPWDPENNDIQSTDKGGEEDDHDPAGIEVQDLAVFMLDDTDILANYGDDVTFPIKVYNQGSVTNEGFTLTNYIPSGYVFNIGDNPGWVDNGDSTVSYTYPDDFVPGDSVELTLILEAQASKGEDAWTNVIEISEDNPVSLLGDALVDIDSDPDAIQANDAGGKVETASDDVVNGDGKNGGGTPLDENPATDEDDQDPEIVRVFDLALKKVLKTAGPYVYGDDHEFEICVNNQGNEPMTNVTITDYIPRGYSFNAGLSPGWTVVDDTTITYNLPRIETCDTLCFSVWMTFEMTEGEVNDWINYSEITEMSDTTDVVRDDVDSNPGSDGPGERDVRPGDDEDNDTDSIDEGGEEDDHDPAGPEVFDLAVFMLDDTEILANYGDDVTFPIMVFNQGNTSSDGFTLTNYIPSGYTFNIGDNPGWVDNGDSTVSYTYPDEIVPGEQVDLTLILEAQPSKGEDAWTNVIEISGDNPVSPTGQVLEDVDSTPDVEQGNDAGGKVETASDDVVNGDGKNGGGTPLDENPATDEDDQDPEIVRVFDLALKKVLKTAGPYVYGDDHEFEICVNNQGNEPMTNVTITDYIPRGYSFNAGLSPGWTVVDDTTITYNLPRIETCDTLCFSVWMTFEMTDGEVNDWINYSEITEMSDTTDVVRDDVDSNPGSDGPGERDVRPGDDEDNDTDSIDEGGEEDDHDPAGPEVFDLAVFMLDDTEILANYGDDVTFPIMVFNQGNTSSDGFTLTNYIPSGYTFNIGDNPGWVDNGDSTVSYTYPDEIVPGEQVDLTLILEAQPSKGDDAWTNVIEISGDNPVSPTGQVLEDVDSTPDVEQGNDAGGKVETSSDDVVNGDGKNGGGTPLDENASTDEDDQDPEIVRVFDLALKKELKTAGPYVYGDDHEFEICVNNQGNEPMTNVTITDYIPRGYSFNAGLSPGWTVVDDTTITYNLPRIETCDTLCFSVWMTFEMTDGEVNDWINYSEITEMSDTNNVVRDDVDSNPGSDGPGERDVRPGDDEDNDTDSIDEGGEEDDHDPAGPEVFDLAVFMLDDTEILANYGDDVTFPIMVFNQGNTSSDGFTLTNYIPSGYTFNIGDNPGWVDNGDSTVSYTYPDEIVPGEQVDLTLILEAQPSKGDDAWTNVIEISGDNPVSPTGQVLEDVDSTPDVEQANDAGGKVETASDDVVNGDGKNGGGTPLDENPATDEDDQDPEIVRVFDLALKKVLKTAGPYVYGDDHEFEICVNNQGNEPMTNVTITDYIPRGYSFNAGLSPGWTVVDDTTITYNLPRIETCDTLCFSVWMTFEMTDGEVNDWINYSEITEMSDTNNVVRDDVDSNPGSDGPGERDVRPGDDEDNDTDSIDEGGEEDDHDPAGPEVFDLAVFMLDDTEILANYGDDVTFPIMVFNQGNTSSDGFTLTNYIPSGYTFNIGDNPGWVDNGDSTVSYTYPDEIVPGEQVDLTLILEAQPSKGEDAWTNVIEISGDNPVSPTGQVLEDVDSTPDVEQANDAGGKVETASDDVVNGDGKNGGGTPLDENPDTDEDDQDPEIVRVFDLALKKELKTAGPYVYGDDHEFEICVNNQGNEPMTNVTITDYIPRGYSFNAGLSPGWTVVDDTTITYNLPRIETCDTLCFSVWMTFEMTDGEVNDWINYSEITEMSDTNNVVRDDVDSNPGSDGPGERDVRPGDDEDNDTDSIDEGGEEDDHDPAGPEIFDLAVFMLDDTEILANYGDDVTFPITVYNQGNTSSDGFTLTNYIPSGYTFNIGDNPGWVDNGDSTVSYTYPDEIIPGDSANLTLILEAQPSKGDDAWTNVIEISGDNPVSPTGQVLEDVDSTPDVEQGNDAGGKVETASDDVVNGDGKNGGGTPLDENPDTDEDDQDPEIVRVFDLALKKELKTLEPYTYGQPHEFEICVNNQGNEPMTNVTITDYIPKGYSFNDGLNPNWTRLDDTTATYVITRIETCDTICFSIWLNLEMTSGGSKDWINYSEITEMRDSNNVTRDDVDSNPGSDGPGERDVLPGDLADNDTNSTDEGGEEDDHDPDGPIIRDVALIKTSQETGPFNYGDVITFDIWVYNQGNFVAQDIEVSDYVPIGFDYDPSNGPDWSYDAGSRTATYNTGIDAILPGDSAMVQIDLILLQAYEPTAWDNYAEVSNLNDENGDPFEDIDSDPNNDDGDDGPSKDDDINNSYVDCSDCIQSLRFPSLLYPPFPLIPQVITEIRVNGNVLPLAYPFIIQSTIGYIQLRDALIAAGYDADYNTDAGNFQGEVFVNYPGVEFTSAVINGETVSWVCRDCRGAMDIDEDDHDPHRPEIVDVALNKTVPGKLPYYVPGDTVPFVITLFNQGNVWIENTLVKDYMPQGFLFDNTIPENNGWADVGGTLEHTYAPRIAPQDSAKIDLWLVVQIAASPTLLDWTNYAEIAQIVDTLEVDRSLHDADSYPDTDAAHERAVMDNDDGDPNDDNVFGDYKNKGEDEDDHDPEKVEVTGALGDKVWKDLDGDGIQDDGEPGLEGVIVTLYTCEGELIKKDTTDADGNYLFDFLIPLVEYFAVFDISPLGTPRCVFTFPNEGVNDSLDSDVNAAGVGPCTLIEPGERDSTYDAGLVELASIGDYVWHDRNADGIQQGSEPGIEGIKVTLYNPDGSVARVTYTDEDGYYIFDYLMPTDYYLGFEYDEVEWFRSPSNEGGDDAADSDVDDTNGHNTTMTTHLDPGEHDPTWDLGLYMCIPLGDVVWFDVDADGVQDPNENGINGVRVYVFDDNGDLVDEAVTGAHPTKPSADGYFKFCVDPGTYYMVFERPGQLASSASFRAGPEFDSDITHQVVLNSTYEFTVLSGEMRCDIDGGFHSKATMGDRVWIDQNQNGIQDGGEPRLSGVTVSAYDENGMMFWQDESDNNGEFFMDGLSKGDYFLKFDPPAGYTFTAPDMGNNDGMDSDVDGSNGPRTTALYRVNEGEHEPDVDAGFVPGFLPIELLEFNAELISDHVAITWTTGSEINSSHFNVERRHESETGFRQIGRKEARGNSFSAVDYDHNDFDIQKTGIYYYRLEQVDNDNSSAFSEVEVIQILGEGSDLTIYPNPATGILNVRFTTVEKGEVRIEMYDELGRLANNKVIDLDVDKGTRTEEVDIEDLSEGIYTLKVYLDGQVKTVRFTKM